MSLIRRTWGAIRRAWDAWNRWWIRGSITAQEWEDVIRPADAATTGGMGFMAFIRALFGGFVNH